MNVFIVCVRTLVAREHGTHIVTEMQEINCTQWYSFNLLHVFLEHIELKSLKVSWCCDVEGVDMLWNLTSALTFCPSMSGNGHNMLKKLHSRTPGDDVI